MAFVQERRLFLLVSLVPCVCGRLGKRVLPGGRMWSLLRYSCDHVELTVVHYNSISVKLVVVFESGSLPPKNLLCRGSYYWRVATMLFSGRILSATNWECLPFESGIWSNIRCSNFSGPNSYLKLSICFRYPLALVGTYFMLFYTLARVTRPLAPTLVMFTVLFCC